MALIKNILQLNVAQTQTLAMTPQLQQAIRLLQLSSLELTAEIQQACDENPLLEIDEKQNYLQEESYENLISSEQTNEDFDPFDNDSSIKHNDIDGLDGLRQFDDNGNIKNINLENDINLPTVNEITKDSDDHISSENFSAQIRQGKSLSIDNDDIYEGETVEDLNSHLIWQLELSPLTGMDKDIAINIIDGIDESGYLTESIEEIFSNLKEKSYPELTLDEVNAVLKLVQHYDPLGVGARNVQECLLIQLNALSDTKEKKLAKKIIENDIKALSNKDYRGLKKKYSIDEQRLKKAIDLILSLNPRPGNVAIKQKSDFVIPDVIVIKNKDNTYSVELNSSAIPSVRINEGYSRLVNFAKDDRERLFFKTNLQEANWFLQSIAKRNETLLKVASCIVKHQQEFMDKGASAMHPMVLNDVATEIEMHESTISRITTEKYINTPKGTFELKYFFSSSVNTDDGGITSSTAIRAKIKEMINKENPKKPFSDNKIAQILNTQGIMVARRTIAKYRESLGIASSSQRKKLI